MEPAHPKLYRLCGLLQWIDVTNGSYQTLIGPRHRLRGKFGRLAVQTDGETTCEIDDVMAQGATGSAR